MHTSASSAHPIRARMMRLWFGLLDRMANGQAARATAQRDFSGPSVGGQILMVVLKTTCLALLMSGAALMVYELRTYRLSLLDDLRAQAEIVTNATTPALSFKDARVAAENLQMLQLQPQITAAALYLSDGRQLAGYLQPGLAQAPLPASGSQAGHVIEQDMVELYRPIEQGGVPLGMLYLRAHDERARSHGEHLWTLLAFTLAGTVVAVLIGSRMQRDVTEPIQRVAQVARDVMARRDFSLRATKTASDEVGQLVDAFNGMLDEVQTRNAALEESNQHLWMTMADRRQAEVALKDLMTQNDTFLATLAHELRSPLAPISNSMSILRCQGDQDPRTRHRALDIMHRQLGQMVRLIDDLLDASRITTGKLQLHRQDADLVQIIQDALETAAPLLEARHHILDVRLPETPVPLRADPTRLCQLFANLLNNAAQYTGEGGLISLHLRVADEVAEVLVRDNGIGIPQTMRESVFDLFVQVDAGRQGRGAGLGVGLPLAREIARLHAGSVQLVGETGRHGTAFIVRLPLKIDQA